MVTRPYTPITQNGTIGEFQLIVKHYQNGLVSTFLKSLQLGQLVDMIGPVGSFRFDREFRGGHHVLIAGGTGITPLFQVKVPSSGFLIPRLFKVF